MFQKLLGASLALSFLCVPTLAEATTIAAMSLEEIASRADEIVRGEVVSVEANAEDGRVITRVLIRPSECYVADGAEPEVIEVIVLGGRTETVATVVHGTESYRVGEEVLVFLSQTPSGAYTSWAMSFSKFSVIEIAGVVEAHRRIDLDALAGPLTGDVTVDVFPMTELDELIRHALELR
jgi:hypothetical protein